MGPFRDHRRQGWAEQTIVGPGEEEGMSQTLLAFVAVKGRDLQTLGVAKLCFSLTD